MPRNPDPETDPDPDHDPDPDPDPRALADWIKDRARELGFDLVGVAPAVAPPGYPNFLAWLNAGRAAGMDYLRRNAEARAHPRSILPEVRSVLVAAIALPAAPPDSLEPLPPNRGRVARYARGDDYHQVFWRRLEALRDRVRTRVPELRARAVADTAPLLERDFARLAGLGWIGKNAMLINKRRGSHILLGALLLDLELPPDPPHESSHCGTCSRCLDACPTGALPQPGVLDANRCISHWTIEHKGPFPDEIEIEIRTDPDADSDPGRPPRVPPLHGWVFGCDVCQDVCPWNRKAPPGTLPELAPRPERAAPDLLEWLADSPDDFRRRLDLPRSAMSRAKRRGLLRNALRVLVENRVVDAIPAVENLLRDPEPLVRELAARALPRLRAALDAPHPHPHPDPDSDSDSDSDQSPST